MANEFIVRKGLIVEGASGGTVVDIQGSQGQLFSVTDDLSGSIFAVSDISGVPIFDVNSSGVSYFDGNVGIGTTSPDSKLDVTGGNITINTTSTTFALFKYGAVGSETSRGSITTDGLDLKINATVDLLLLPTGNVGIGTTAPAVKLQISDGGVRITGTTSTTGQIDVSPNFGALRFYDGTTFQGGLGTGQWASNPSGASNTDSVIYLTSGNSFHVSNTTTAALTVASSGKVGIGTTSPSSTLEVSGRISGGELGNPKITRDDLNFYVDFNDKSCVSGQNVTEAPIDLGPNNYDLTLSGGANFEYLGGIGTFYFDGNADHISINNFNNLSSTSNTYEVWHYANSQNGWETMWDSGNERPLLGTFNNNLRAYPNATVLGTVDTGKWYHFVWAFASDSDLDVYINGVRVAEAVNWGSSQRLGVFQAWLGGDGSAETTDGYISIARAYTRQLTPTDVLQNYNAEVGMFATQTPSLGIVQAGGNVGIGTNTPSQKLHVSGSARVTGAYYDSGNSAGTAGQVLSSTATGTDWVDATTGDITSVVAGTGMTGGGTSGAVTLNVIGGTGITANADDIAIDATVATLAGTQTFTNKSGSNSQWTNDEGYTDLVVGTAATNAMAGDTTTITTTQAANIVTNNAKVTSSWTATGNDIYNSNPGFVGIGTSGGAAAKLEVAGTGTASVPTVQINNSSSDSFNHSIELFAANLTQDETNALIIGQRKTTKNAGYLGYLFSSAASNDNVLTFGHIGATNLMGLTGDGKLGIGNVGPSQALHVTGNARVTGAFYDSNNSAGSSGQVLSSTATGTDWVAAGATVYTPDVFEITTNQSITSQGTLLSMSGTQIIDGSTGATIPSGGGNTITATQNGVYEISYTMYLETTHNVRQIIGAYIEKTPSGSQPSQLAGSFSSVYMRVGGSNQGFAGTITNTFYAVLAANDAIKIRMGRTDSNTSPTGISIQVPDYPTSGVKHVISLRKINAAS